MSAISSGPWLTQPHSLWKVVKSDHGKNNKGVFTSNIWRKKNTLKEMLTNRYRD